LRLKLHISQNKSNGHQITLQRYNISEDMNFMLINCSKISNWGQTSQLKFYMRMTLKLCFRVEWKKKRREWHRREDKWKINNLIFKFENKFIKANSKKNISINFLLPLLSFTVKALKQNKLDFFFNRWWEVIANKDLQVKALRPRPRSDSHRKIFACPRQSKGITTSYYTLVYILA
jgi:hypothetical protein